jgi:hypothetical protein
MEKSRQSLPMSYEVFARFVLLSDVMTFGLNPPVQADSMKGTQKRGHCHG